MSSCPLPRGLLWSLIYLFLFLNSSSFSFWYLFVSLFLPPSSVCPLSCPLSVVERLTHTDSCQGEIPLSLSSTDRSFPFLRRWGTEQGALKYPWATAERACLRPSWLFSIRSLLLRSIRHCRQGRLTKGVCQRGRLMHWSLLRLWFWSGLQADAAPFLVY